MFVFFLLRACLRLPRLSGSPLYRSGSLLGAGSAASCSTSAMGSSSSAFGSAGIVQTPRAVLHVAHWIAICFFFNRPFCKQFSAVPVQEAHGRCERHGGARNPQVHRQGIAIAKVPHHRRAQPCAAAPRIAAGARRARRATRRCTRRKESSLKRPPISAASTHKRWGSPRASSG